MQAKCRKDDNMDFNQFIRPELLILIPVLYALGMFLKTSTMLEDKNIPMVLLVAGCVLSILYICSVLGEGYSTANITVAVIQGILVASASVFGNQVIKQLNK